MAQLDAGCWEKGLLTRGGSPNYTQLALVCGFNHGLLVAWRRQDKWPSWAALERLARYAGQPVAPWLHAGGFGETE